MPNSCANFYVSQSIEHLHLWSTNELTVVWNRNSAQIIRLIVYFKALIYDTYHGISILLQCDKITTMIITLLSGHKSKGQWNYLHEDIE